MSQKLKLVLRIVANAIVLVVLVLAFLLHGVKLFGLTPYSVLSPSMQSVYPTGSLIYVKDVEPATLEVQDVITFRMGNGSIATHRIVEIVPDEGDGEVVRFRTKGDENETADGPLVDYSSVVGKPVFCIPKLGFLATYMTTTSGNTRQSRWQWELSCWNC